MATFSITGNFLTERIRDLWDSKSFKQAIQLGLESLEGSELHHIVKIIDGECKLIGTNDLDLVSDGSYKPEVSFLDILDYSMIPNNGYFRIYEQDSREAQRIIDWFQNTSPDSFGDKKRQDLIYSWFQLLPEVRNDYSHKINHWLSVYMRKLSPNREVNTKANFYSINLVETEAPIDLDRKTFDEICDKFYIFGDREETWKQAQETRKRIKEPTKEKIETDIKNEFLNYKSDITMKSDYGWLSPDGRFTVCDFAEHEVLASIMCKYFKYQFTPEQEIGKQLSDVLLKFGYVKIHRDDVGLLHFTKLRKFTPEQELKIDRYKFMHKL